MQTINLKSLDPVDQALLRNAAKSGIELGWERFERLQPQDGFLRLGLSCPLDCLYGPCRIDPFGRGPDRGICGLDKNGMVSASLFRLCHRGVLEVLSCIDSPSTKEHFNGSSSLHRLINKHLTAHGLPALSTNNVHQVVALSPTGSMDYQEMVVKTAQLSLAALTLYGHDNDTASPSSRSCRSGYGVLEEDRIRIGLCGTVPGQQIMDLAARQKDDQTPLQLLGLGSWVSAGNGFLPLACSSGNAELLISSGAIHLVVAGSGTDPALLRLCGELAVPVITAEQTLGAEEIIKRATNRSLEVKQAAFFSDLSPPSEYQIHLTSDYLDQQAGETPGRKIGLVGGTDTPHQTLGDLPRQLYKNLSDRKMIVGTWGDASHWIASDVSIPRSQFITLDPWNGPLSTVKGLVDRGELDRLSGICFTGIKRCRELTMALGLCFLGCRVFVATPLPILGSKSYCQTLSALVEKTGGEFRFVDHPAGPDEISEWFAQQ